MGGPKGGLKSSQNWVILPNLRYPKTFEERAGYFKCDKKCNGPKCHFWQKGDERRSRIGEDKGLVEPDMKFSHRKCPTTA